MKKIAIVATTAALTLSLGAFAGCAPTTVGDTNASKPAAKEISTETVTTESADGKTLVMYAATERPVSHAGEAFDDCTACHTNSGNEVPALPADHEGRTGDMCGMCHAEDGAAVALPADHEGRTEDTCTSCHAVEAISIVAIPEDHYVNDSYSSGKINDMHENCLACHGIDEEAVKAAQEAAEKAAAEAEAAAKAAEEEAADAEDGDAPAEVDAPDCAPCHGDAHKPGEENPHGYPTAAAGADDADEADDKAADDKAVDDKKATDAKDDKADDKTDSKSDSKSSSTSSSSTKSDSKTDSKSDASSAKESKSDAPDCAPCHGDAHKPGDENPHGY